MLSARHDRKERQVRPAAGCRHLSRQGGGGGGGGGGGLVALLLATASLLLPRLQVLLLNQREQDGVSFQLPANPSICRFMQNGRNSWSQASIGKHRF